MKTFELAFKIVCCAGSEETFFDFQIFVQIKISSKRSYCITFNPGKPNFLDLSVGGVCLLICFHSVRRGARIQTAWSDLGR